MALNSMFYPRTTAEAGESSDVQSEESREDIQAAMRYKYSAETLMTMLDKEKLEALEEEFNDHPDGIELHNFIWLMKCAMTVPEEEKAELVLGLYHLFQEIDINGDEHMEWSEFTQFIIDAVMGQQSKDKHEDKELTASEILEIAQFHKSRRYQASNTIDRSSHYGLIHTAAYSHSLDLIWTVENNAPCLRFYTMKSEVKMTVTPPTKLGHFVLAGAYSDREHCLLVSTSDRNIHVYEREANGFRYVRHFALDFVAIRIWYFEKHAAWLVASGNPMVKHEKPEKIFRKGDNRLRHIDIRTGTVLCRYVGHSDVIMDAIEILNPFCVATAAMDGVVFLWDLHEGKKKGELSGRHERGVRQIDYCPDYGGNIISVGYEKDIHVWSPEVSLSKCYVGKLEGHNCPVVSCKFFRARPTCVSVDEKGNIRVWDIRQFLCLQIISQESGKVEISRVLPITRHEKFIVAGKRLAWYDLVKDTGVRSIYQDMHILHIDFNEHYLQFVVVTKYDIRIYDAVTGRLKKLFSDIQDSKTESELSAFSLDHRHRIFFLGDISGSIRAYNYSNGSLMKRIVGEFRNDEEWNSEISCLHFCTEDKILLTASWNSTIKVYDIQDLNDPSLLRTMNGGHLGSDIMCLAYSSVLSLIASASSNGLVTVWDFESGKLEAVCTPHKAEVTDVEFLDPYPVLAATSADGLFCLYTVRPYPGRDRYHCLMVIENSSWHQGKDLRVPVNCLRGLQFYGEGILRHRRRKHVKKAQGKSIHRNRDIEDESKAEDEGDFEWVEDTNIEVIEEKGRDTHRERNYLYLGDSKGYIKMWNFESTWARFSIEPVSRPEREKASYNPRRRDERNAENDVKIWIKETEQDDLPAPVNVEVDILVREWKAHKDQVESIRLIKDPPGLVSYSSQNDFKLWSREGELWGVINLRSTDMPKLWRFPFDWEAKRRQDIQKVKDIMALIEEHLDFTTQSLSTMPIRIGKQMRHSKPKQTHKVRAVIPPKGPSPKENTGWEEDDYEEPVEKPAKVERKYSGITLEIKKMLDELDEKRTIEMHKTKKHEDSLKKHDNKSHKIEKSASILSPMHFKGRAKLPKVNFAKQTTKKSSFNVDEIQLFDKAVNKFKAAPRYRPALGTSYNFGMRKLGQNLLGDSLNKRKLQELKQKHQIKTDIKFRTGEGKKLLSRAISEQTLAIHRFK